MLDLQSNHQVPQPILEYNTVGMQCYYMQIVLHQLHKYNYVTEFLSCLCDNLVAQSVIDNKGVVLTKEDIQPSGNIPDKFLIYPLMP